MRLRRRKTQKLTGAHTSAASEIARLQIRAAESVGDLVSVAEVVVRDAGKVEADGEYAGVFAQAMFNVYGSMSVLRIAIERAQQLEPVTFERWGLPFSMFTVRWADNLDSSPASPATIAELISVIRNGYDARRWTGDVTSGLLSQHEERTGRGFFTARAILEEAGYDIDSLLTMAGEVAAAEFANAVAA